MTTTMRYTVLIARRDAYVSMLNTIMESDESRPETEMKIISQIINTINDVIDNLTTDESADNIYDMGRAISSIDSLFNSAVNIIVSFSITKIKENLSEEKNKSLVGCFGGPVEE